MRDWDTIFASFPDIKTTRYILRKPRHDDREAIFAIMSDPEVYTYLGRHPMRTLADADTHIDMYLKRYETQTGKTWLITTDDTHDVIGTCGFFALRKAHARAEVGYLLSPAWWGKGVMSEVLPLVLTYGFETMQLHSVVAQIDPANEASKRLLEKQGFMREGYFREDFFDPVKQCFTDTAVYGLLMDDWRKHRDTAS